jgi:hypothetical protein
MLHIVAELGTQSSALLDAPTRDDEILVCTVNKEEHESA